MSILLSFLAKILLGFLGAWLTEITKQNEDEKAGAEAQAARTGAEADGLVQKAQAAASSVAASDVSGLQRAEASDPDNRDNQPAH